MAQPIPPHVTRRHIKWHRFRLYLIAGLTAAMFLGSWIVVARRQAKAQSEAERAEAVRQAEAVTKLSGEAYTMKAEGDEFAHRIAPFALASQEVRRLEAMHPVNHKALAAAKAHQYEVMQGVFKSPQGK
ncbi:hypothetical protein [Geothrix sp. PMB-07]|uniref:hypothetical protein n=1 Tax=Geothrix sp. PMB-07 TaxID=3068640 RepID=UPI002742931F|nr:hypothetical protein [Geothrix sp. PMB-07]WLT30661.1 hypothetical protein Q9293_13145 [Geothrix sp. PMB-07]